MADVKYITVIFPPVVSEASLFERCSAGRATDQEKNEDFILWPKGNRLTGGCFLRQRFFDRISKNAFIFGVNPFLGGNSTVISFITLDEPQLFSLNTMFQIQKTSAEPELGKQTTVNYFNVMAGYLISFDS